MLGIIVSGAVIFIFVLFRCRQWRKRRHQSLRVTVNPIFGSGNDSKRGNAMDEAPLIPPTLGAESSDEDGELPPVPTIPSPVSESVIRMNSFTTVSAASKFTAKQIIFGKPEEAAYGLPDFMGLTDNDLVQYHTDGMLAVVDEISRNGNSEDRENLKMILAGHYYKQGTNATADSRLSLDELMQHPAAVAARLRKHHVLALRMYTTSTFKSINEPMRQRVRPHPLGATTYFISEAIKLLRVVKGAASKALIGDQVYWRGLADLKLDTEFLQAGGTEFACMSTTTNRDVAMEFAEGECPLVFKFTTKDFMQRGADISFLSVYPEEEEILYPPLTYLRPVRVFFDEFKGVRVVVGEVVPVFPS